MCDLLRSNLGNLCTCSLLTSERADPACPVRVQINLNGCLALVTRPVTPIRARKLFPSLWSAYHLLTCDMYGTVEPLTDAVQSANHTNCPSIWCVDFGLRKTRSFHCSPPVFRLLIVTATIPTII